jgi:hypothetical protein
MFYAVVSYWLVGMPCAYVFGFPLGWGAVGIWWGMVRGPGAGGRADDPGGSGRGPRGGSPAT